MESTIEALWYGDITPAEDCGVHDRQLEALLQLLQRNREYLEKELSPEQKERLGKYADSVDEYLCEMSVRAFRDGFSLASRLWAEVFAGGVS